MPSLKLSRLTVETGGALVGLGFGTAHFLCPRIGCVGRRLLGYALSLHRVPLTLYRPVLALAFHGRAAD